LIALCWTGAPFKVSATSCPARNTGDGPEGSLPGEGKRKSLLAQSADGLAEMGESASGSVAATIGQDTDKEPKPEQFDFKSPAADFFQPDRQTSRPAMSQYRRL